MSLAGRRSSQGDEYQLRVALHWLIQLLDSNDIGGIQVESLGLPEVDIRVTVDDVVVLHNDGRTSFIQAKKNQPEHRYWTFSDKGLQVELCKARDQLEACENSEVWFYSRSPYGDLKALAETCRTYPDYRRFLDAPSTSIELLRKFAKIVERPEEEAFALALRLRFGPTYEFKDWDRENLKDLDRILPKADLGIQVLERLLGSHQSQLRDPKHIICRADVLAELEQQGLALTPKRSEAEILESFRTASRIGRGWLRTVGGERIPRQELIRLLELIEQGRRTILLTDRPGTGKTCLLLDLADHIEQLPALGLLFIKGDLFADAENESDLAGMGLPLDIVGQCARLTAFRRVVVVIDSLDVLSTNRQHGALKLFLGVMDRLARIDGVTLIAACRDFDLQYDPLLRGRTWEHKVTLEPLDFTSVVEPFLLKWSIMPSTLSTELRTLLQLPQNLRLFEKLAHHDSTSNIFSAHQLYDHFLDDVVLKDPQLGEEALHAVNEMAMHLTRQRSLKYTKAAFKASKSVIQRLISQEVLIESSPGMLGFSHQSLADSLVIRNALSRNMTMAEFILDHPPLPFIRPAVRAFFFYLRVADPDAFRRQIWAVLDGDQIPYHLKRLLCESLAETTPDGEDWSLLRRLFRTYPDLFRRLLWRTQSDDWFDMLAQHWLPDAKVSEDRESWLIQFVDHLSVWMNTRPAAVVALWREAITQAWAEKQNTVRGITFRLAKFEHWHTEGVRELLEALVENATGETGSLGRIMSRWVEATDGGDELLWTHITKSITHDNASRWDIGKELHCKPHDFHDDHFLADRLEQSDKLLSLALYSLESWSTSSANRYGEVRFRSEFLHNTSWERQHSYGDMHHLDALGILMNALERAIKHRARDNDAWWRAREPVLRSSREAAIRYLLIETYKDNIEANIQAIEYQLTDAELLHHGRLDYELGLLMRAAYPFISESAQVVIQTTILALLEDEKDNGEDMRDYACRKVYNLLAWIPSLFRTYEAQAFIDAWKNQLGYDLPSPRLYSWGGWVGSPVSTQGILDLSDDTLIRLLRHYNDYTEWHERLEVGGLVGGRNQIRTVLREASSRNPSRFLQLYVRLLNEDLHPDYAHAVVNGLAEYLRYRAGNVQRPVEWAPVEPVPDDTVLAGTLLNMLERYPVVSEDGSIISHALEACCSVLDDPESADRLIFLLFVLLRSDDPTEERTAERSKDLLFVAINSTRGIAAESAMILCNKLLEKHRPLPELLPGLLRYFARDRVAAVRTSILQRLPHLLHRSPDLGWQLLADVFREPQKKLWAYAERCFYYEYRDHFDRVKPYLDRLYHEGMGEAGATWGRISALACLAGHISQEELFKALTSANIEALQGVAQVFNANISRREHTEACHQGLLTLLQRENLSPEIMRTIEGCFREKADHRLLRHELALAFLGTVSASAGDYEFHYFLDWLSNEARHDPRSALEVTQILADKMEAQDHPHRIWHTEPLIAALVEILREADETNDSAFIHAAIRLQDRFLRMDVAGMEDLLVNAEKG